MGCEAGEGAFSVPVAVAEGLAPLGFMGCEVVTGAAIVCVSLLPEVVACP